MGEVGLGDCVTVSLRCVDSFSCWLIKLSKEQNDSPSYQVIIKSQHKNGSRINKVNVQRVKKQFRKLLTSSLAIESKTSWVKAQDI